MVIYLYIISDTKIGYRSQRIESRYLRGSYGA